MTPGNGTQRDDDYLWDRDGAVDPEIVALERLLVPHGWRGGERRRAVAETPARGRRRPRSRWRGVFAAAAVLVAAAVGVHSWYVHRLAWPEARAWQVAALDGGVRVDGALVEALDVLPPGAVLETAPGASVRLRAARIGEVIVGEGSRFRLVETRGGRHRTDLERGVLWARVWAPPGAFGVATSAGDVFDLGCEFVLRADEGGSGSLTVRSGWVQVDNRWREVLVPQGARVEFEDGRPGTPYDLGASDAFLDALRAIDAQGRGADPAGEAVHALVAASRPQDAISLLSLLQAYPALAEGGVYDRLEAWMPADARVTRAALRERGAHALSPWWDALPYPRMKRWWMQWPDAFATRADSEALLRGDPR